MKCQTAAVLAISAWRVAAQTTSSCSTSVVNEPAATPSIRHIFAFGSSWSETNFNQSNRQPSPEHPLGNPGFDDTDNAQGGPNYLRYLTDVYNTTTTLLYDFARGGATIDNHVVPSRKEDLLFQVASNFTPAYSSQKDKLWRSDNSIFNVWMCDNDVLLGLNRSDHAGLVKNLTDSYFDTAVAQLYDAGARKFMFIDVPAQERSPKIALEDPKADIPKYLDLKWRLDEALFARVGEFQMKHPDVKTQFFNASKWMNPILDDPVKFGFNANSTCLPPAKDCVWHNDFHLVPAAHKLMAEAMMPLYEELF